MIVLFILFLIVITSLLIYALFIEPFQIEVSNVKIPDAESNLKILHLSDFHIRRIGKREKRVLEVLNQEDYDIVLFTGDFIERLEVLDESLNYFKKIIRGKPAFGVLGNNDYGRRSKPDRINSILKNFKKINLRILRNQNVGFSDKITIVGIDDPHKYKDDAAMAFEGVSKTTFKVLLMHSPEGLENALEFKPELIFCGHTHGGQIRLPIIGAFFLNIKRRGRFKLEPGLNRLGESFVILNRGIGTTLLPVRFLCKPQIIFIHI